MKEEEIREYLCAAVRRGMKFSEDGPTSIMVKVSEGKKPVQLNLTVTGDSISVETGGFFSKRRYSFLKSELM